MRSHPRAQEIAKVLHTRERVMASRDLLYCSPAIRALIEEDIPLLMGMLSEAG